MQCKISYIHFFIRIHYSYLIDDQAVTLFELGKFCEDSTNCKDFSIFLYMPARNLETIVPVEQIISFVVKVIYIQS